VTAAARLRTGGYVLLLCALASTIVPLLPFVEPLPVWKHHLAHAIVLTLAAASGLEFAALHRLGQGRPAGSGSGGWLVVTVCMPLLSMFLMWPTTYAWLERHPPAHGAEHLCFVALGFMAAYGGEKYVPGVGWISAIMTVLTAVAAAGGFGVVIGS
jgi:hypothetical protein